MKRKKRKQIDLDALAVEDDGDEVWFIDLSVNTGESSRYLKAKEDDEDEDEDEEEELEEYEDQDDDDYNENYFETGSQEDGDDMGGGDGDGGGGGELHIATKTYGLLTHIFDSRLRLV